MITTSLDLPVDDGEIALHEEDVVDLLARALAEWQMGEVGFCDPEASAIARALDIDVAHRLEDPAPLRRSLAVTMLVDAIVAGFLAKHPDGLAIGLHQGLCTRFSRVDTGRLRWVDVVMPAVAEFKRSLITPNDRRLISASCSESWTSVGSEATGADTWTSWVECLARATDVPTIIVAQRSLCRRGREAALALFYETSKYVASGTEIVLDYDARLPLRPSAIRQAACVELAKDDGTIERFPRLRFVSADEYPPMLAHDMRGLDGVSRLFRGRGVRSVAHLRFA